MSLLGVISSCGVSPAPSVTDWGGLTSVFIGDSRIEGYGLSSPSTERWPALLSAAMNGLEDNNAVSGSAVTQAVAGLGCARPVYSDALIPTKGSHKYLYLGYGVNDIGLNAAGITVAAFKTDYQAAITHAISSKGWSASDIVLITPFYVDPTAGWPQYVGACGVSTAANAARHDAYAAAVIELAQDNNTILADIYNWRKAQGTPAANLFDDVHMNAAGHIEEADYFINLDYTPQ